MIKGKKGDVGNFLIVLIIIFFLAVSFIISSLAVNKMNEAITKTEINSTDASAVITSSMTEMTEDSVPNAFIIIFALLIIGLIVSSFLIRVHPIWIFIYIIVLAMTIFLGVYLGNIYQDITEVEALSSVASHHTSANWIMEHITLVVLGFGALSMVIVFSKIITPGGYSNIG